MLSNDEIAHLARLARLGIDDAAAKKFAMQINDILAYVGQLQEVDVNSVKPTSQVTGLQNVTRKDEIVKTVTREEMLSCTELPIELEQIKVKSVIKN